MNVQPPSNLLSKSQSFSKITSVVVTLVGCVVLVGWASGYSNLKSVFLGDAAMKVNTAVALVLAGVSLWLSNSRKKTIRVQHVAQAFGAATFLLGSLTFVEFVTGRTLGIDELFVRLFAVTGVLPGRMAPTTAVSLSLFGLALATLDWEVRRRRPVHFFTLPGIAIPFLALIGYVYGVDVLYSLGPDSSMTLHAAATLFLLGLGILHARPTSGLMQTITSAGPGGVTLRRVLPLAIIVYVVVGWFRLLGQEAGLYDLPFGVALFALSNILIVSVLLWRVGASLNRSDAVRREVETGLQKSEERYRLLFDLNPLPMWVYDRESLAFRAVNDAAVHHYGYSRDEFLSMTIKSIRPDDEVPALLKNVADSAMPFQSSGTWHHRTRDGRIIDVEIASHELAYDGKPARLVLAQDVTERRLAEEARRQAEGRYRNTLDHMLEGCQIIGFDWRYLYVNPVAASQARSTREELLGRTMMEVYPGIDRTPMFLQLRRCMEERVPVRMENEFVYPDGNNGWFDLSMEPVPEGTFILSDDITKVKELDEELKKHRGHLEELVVQRTSQLEAVNKELEAFSYSVSHDLRAPLRHINGFIDLLGKGIGHTLDETNKHHLAVVADAAKHMGNLIDDLLGFSRMSRTDLMRSRVNLVRLVEESIRELGSETEGRHVVWNVGELPIVHADAAMMRLVVLNLLSNAVKYTRTRSQAQIDITCTRGAGRDIVLVVRDNGVGFDMRFADKLFGVFQRLHRSDEFEGTGIGLASVRRVIQRHGGRTWAEGTVGKGAAFYCSLPHIEGEDV